MSFESVVTASRNSMNHNNYIILRMYVRKQQIEAKRGTKQGCSPKEHMPRVERVCHEPLQKQ